MKNNSLIPVTKDERGNIIVSGRDLHDFLEIKDHFTDWMKRMIEYGFNKEIDYVEVYRKNPKNLSGGRPQKDIAMTLDMAKEISMIQRNERGKKARQYFIKVEKQYKNNQPKLPTTPQEMTKALLENMNANNEDIKELKSDVNVLKNERSLSEGEYNYIARQVNKKVYSIVDDKNFNQAQTKLLFKDINGAILALTGVKFRSRLQIKHFDEVRELIDSWYPSTQTVIKIREIGRQTELDV